MKSRDWFVEVFTRLANLSLLVTVTVLATQPIEQRQKSRCANWINTAQISVQGRQESTKTPIMVRTGRLE